MTRRPPRSPLFPYTTLFRSLPRPPVVARLLPEGGPLALAALVVLVVHPLHPVRRPARPRLAEGEAEVGEALGDPLEDDRRELAHLAEGVRAGVRLDEAREKVHAGAAEMRARGVDGEHHVQALGLFVDRCETLVADNVAAVRREHRAD